MLATPGAFPTETVVSFCFAAAVTLAAVVLTWFVGRDLTHWWNARQWTPTTCTVIRAEPELRYRYEVDGRAYESGAVRIGPDSEPGSTDGPAPGDELQCWFDPAQPSQALLRRDYDGWWWLPAAWLFSLFMLYATLPALSRELWLWATYRPDPPLTWAQWLASFYKGNAWMYTATGLACLVPGLVLLKFMTFDPWWNWWRAQSWSETSCEITSTRIRGWSGEAQGTSSGPRAGGLLLDIEYAYDVAGRRHTSNRYSPWRMGDTEWLLQAGQRNSIEGLQRRFAVGSTHRCYVSPDDPSRAYIFRGRTAETVYLSSTWSVVLTLLGLIILAARI